jgi:hypothetical protein
MRTFSRLSICFAAAALSALALSSPPAQADDIQVGVLKCDVASGWGFVFGSSKDLKCLFTRAGTKETERYTGEIDKFGVDIGYTESGVILWAVFAPSKDVPAGALKGTYAGATAEVTASAGLGANVLVGGGNSIALQPLSISGQQGLNVAAGIGAVKLRPAM